VTFTRWDNFSKFGPNIISHTVLGYSCFFAMQKPGPHTT